MGQVTMTNPSDKPSPTDPRDISTDRRGFFREILLLGADGVERTGRQVAKRWADPLPRTGAKPPEPAPRLTPPADSVSRENARPQGDA